MWSQDPDYRRVYVALMQCEGELMGKRIRGLMWGYIVISAWKAWWVMFDFFRTLCSS